ncbi:hypothetical protein Trydic_g3697 [Trypoxylus dichotomus]
MARLSEKERNEILMLKGCGNEIRSQNEVRALFNSVHPERHPITQSAVNGTVTKCSEMGLVRDVPRPGRSKVATDQELNMLLKLEENAHISTRTLASHNNVNQGAVVQSF